MAQRASNALITAIHHDSYAKMGLGDRKLENLSSRKMAQKLKK